MFGIFFLKNLFISVLRGKCRKRQYPYVSLFLLLEYQFLWKYDGEESVSQNVVFKLLLKFDVCLDIQNLAVASLIVCQI